jgi:hypothetical protein
LGIRSPARHLRLLETIGEHLDPRLHQFCGSIAARQIELGCRRRLRRGGFGRSDARLSLAS